MNSPVNVQKSKRNPKHRTGWHASINSEIVSVANSNDIARLIDTIQKYLHEMNLVNITTAIHRLAKMVETGAQGQTALVRHPIIQALTSAAQGRLKSISEDGSAPSCQALSNIMWSLAVLQIANWNLLQEVALLTVNYMAYFKPLELSTLLWAFAKVFPEAPRRSGGISNCFHSVFEAAVDYIRSNVQKFTFRNLITAIGAFATIGKSSPSLFKTVAGQMLKIINTANRLELAKTAWAFGAASIHNDKLFGVVAKHALPQLQSFQQQELSNLLWGFASNSVFHQELFAKASFCAQRMDLNAQQLANILWALTRMRPQWPVASKTMRALMPRCCEQLQAFKPQEFATIAIAAAKVFGHVGEDLGQLDEPLPSEVAGFFSAALPTMLPQMHQFSDQSLANVATAYTALRATGVMVVLTNAGQLALTRLHRLDPPLLLQFIRTFSTDFSGFEASTDQKLACKGLAQAFFSEAARRLERFGLEEQRSLAQLCSRSQGVHADFDLEDLRRHCLSISAAAIITKGHEEKKVHKGRHSPSGMTTINLSDDSIPSPSSLSHHSVGPASPAQGDVQGETQESQSVEGTPAEKDNSQGASLQSVLKVKNTFVEHCSEDPEYPWVSQMVLSRPPLDFLSETKRAIHAETVQALREDYQFLRAVEGLDFSTNALASECRATHPSDMRIQEPSTAVAALDDAWIGVGSDGLPALQQRKSSLRDESVDTALDDPRRTVSTGALLRQQRRPSLLEESADAAFQDPLDDSTSASKSKASERRRALPSEALQAFRKDYQELRAVPGLDWNTEHGPWLTQGTESLYATSACMKQHKRCTELGGLPSPLPFLEESSEIEALRQIYRMTGEFTAIPGVDFSPQKVQQNEVQSALGATSLDRLRSLWRQHAEMPVNGPGLCESKALSRPPLDFLAEVTSNRTQQESLKVDATRQHVVTWENPPEHLSEEQREPSLPSTSPTARQSQESERRHVLQPDALQAARADYQKLRAVPGLDWSTRHDSSYITSAYTKSQRRELEMDELSLRLPFFEEGADIEALRQFYRKHGAFTAAPGLDSSAERRVQQKEAPSALQASPLRIAPSTWLVAQSEKCVDGQWLCERKVLTQAPFDFLARAETNRAQEDAKRNSSNTVSVAEDFSTVDTTSRREASYPDSPPHSVNVDHPLHLASKEVGNSDSSTGEASVHSGTQQTRIRVNGEEPVLQGTVGRTAAISKGSERRHALQSEALQAFRKDYQELRAVPGLDWNTGHGPWLAQGSESLYATSACMKQQNRCAELGGLPSPLPFLEENAEIETLRQFYRTTGEFSAVPGVDFPVSQKVRESVTRSAASANPICITPSRWLRELDGPAPSDPKALSRPPLDFLDETQPMHWDARDLPTASKKGQHLATLDHAPPKDNDPEPVGSVPQCPGTPPPRRKIEIDNSSPIGSSPLTRSEGSERRYAFQSEALRAFRKDYQELRAVPGLDWKIEHGPWLAHNSESLYATSACMKQHNRCAEVGGLPPPLPFLEENAEIETLRQIYRSTGEFTAVPGVDFSVPHKVQHSREQAAIDENPLRITPSRWLLDCDEEVFNGPSLCEPKALSRPPLDFLLE